jgi:hypothetical protein
MAGRGRPSFPGYGRVPLALTHRTDEPASRSLEWASRIAGALERRQILATGGAGASRAPVESF